SAEGFAASMSELGIGAHDTVVAYDDAGGTVAARLVWMLRVLGVDAALLDGGIAAYDGPLETDPVERPPADFPVHAWPVERLADIDAAVAGPLVVDARAGERFRGEVEPIDPRPGHIPGARSLPTAGHVGADGRFLPVDELRQRFAVVGVDSPNAEVIAYCGSGVNATHTLLALEHAGLGNGRLYAGSWSQYSATDRPAALGDS
ncbi:MAG: thiosulfate/3-mercaptopyruvate sulfurtransferase, partial [Frankiaceae bacterium]|nr:thiosulfate/3-mercaptopyruvate sulfurtransferase [Frankiaceae bacterium]